MPRTRATNKKKDSEHIKNEYIESTLRKITHDYKRVLGNLEKLETEFISKLEQSIKEKKVQYMHVGHLTISEYIQDLSSSDTNGTIPIHSVLADITSSTYNSKMGTKKLSCVEDEGYLTAESSNGATLGRSGGTTRQSRARQRISKSRRISKSASSARSASATTSKSVSILGRSASSTASRYNSVLGKFKTPHNNRTNPANSYGVVTPKVGPNTPQIILRRPKAGEVAFSLQGSPLFTGSVVSESIANVNIPLEDGKLFTIQPQRGLRLSQIPKLDPETTRQLQTLRDHLNKVCASALKR